MTASSCEPPRPPRQKIDSTRASRDGHAYHEAWAARSALELLLPNTTLAAIALEGFAVSDSEGMSDAADQVADTVHYHGAATALEASKLQVVQFKYSIASKDVPVRAADVAKTLAKFAKAEVDFLTLLGEARVEQVVCYVYQTNRPIHPDLTTALEALAAGGAVPTGGQAEQISLVCQGLKDGAGFLSRVSLVGAGGMRADVERAARRQIADWSAPDDPESEKRLLKLQNLIRAKAGIDGQQNNLIDRVAVLAELGVDHERQLYPTEYAFPEVAHVLRRPCLDALIQVVAQSSAPVLVHGSGGVGKTVLMQGLAEALAQQDTVVLFDGFGAGRWRDPADGRDRPERTLVHLANLLAGQGLSDILLPIADEASLLRAFRRRLSQAVHATRENGGEGRVVLILDAIDHAALEAKARGRRSFADLLLTSLTVDPIVGVVVVASCRTERIDLAIGDIVHQEFVVPGLTAAETRAMAVALDASVSETEIIALHQRSGANPRCLDALVREGRPYDGARPGGAGADPNAVLDVMLTLRLNRAKAEAKARGATDKDLALLLAGLALLPPPVPLPELAAACGLADAAVESFASDLAPLLERTPHGLMFRDEPTETLIRSLAKPDQVGRAALRDNLDHRQQVSIYAARALPSLLTEFDDADRLVKLAFDPRLPAGATKVSGQEIQLQRVLAAQALCARHGRTDDLLGLLLEASRLAAGHERADELLYDFPDLAAISDDPDMLRRLFASQSGWAGGRHSRLAISELMLNDRASAWLNASRAIDWHNWLVDRKAAGDDEHRPPTDPLDIVGFALALFYERSPAKILRWLDHGDREAALARLERLLDFAERLASLVPERREALDRVAAVMPRLGRGSQPILLAALKFSNCDAVLETHLLRALAAAAPTPSPEFYDPDRDRADASLGLVLASARACRRRLQDEARAILADAVRKPPDTHDFDNFADNVTPGALTVLYAGVSAAAHRRAVSAVDLAPEDLRKRLAPNALTRGPKAFEAAVERLVSPRTSSHAKRRRPITRPDDYVQRLGRIWSKRIRPLTPIAQGVRQICVARTAAAQRALAMEQISAAVGPVRKSRHDDGARYRAGVALGALFPLLDALGGLDDATGLAFADAYQADVYASASQLIAMTTRLSRASDCPRAVEAFAALAARAIATNTNVEQRISALGDLARAVWRSSASEARGYFRRALDLAEAVGSDDYEGFQGILSLCAAYDGDPVPQPSSQTLARVLELNLDDSDRFPWSSYADAMVPLAGMSTLAIASRLDDRGAASLHWSFPPLLERLVRTGFVKPEVGCALIGLTQANETRNWGVAATVGALAPNIAPGLREELFDWALTELDREYQARPYSVSVTQFAALARQWLAPSAPARQRIEGFERDLASTQASSTFAAKGDADISVEAVDLRDPDSIDRALTQRGPDNWVAPTRLLQGLAARAISIEDRLGFLGALTAVTEPDLSDILRALEPVLPGWSQASVAIHDILPGIGRALAAKHAHSLASSSWQAGHSLQRLKTGFRLTASELVTLVCEALQSSGDDVSGNGWLQLASDLAPHVSPMALGAGIGRFLDHVRQGLPPEAGEGPWRREFLAPSDSDTAVAALLWRLLGHHDAAQRWRAAHALRRLARTGQWNLVAAVASHYGDVDGGAFADPDQPFFVLNARLWLLIALARLGKDHPQEVCRFRPLLEGAAFDPQFPHVGFRVFAEQALRDIAANLPHAEAQPLRARLDAINQSPFPPFEPTQDDWVLLHQARPDPSTRDDRFSLDYEFEKYQVGELVRLFGVPGWRIEDAITDFAKTWGAGATSMFSCSRAPSWDHDRGSWRMGLPKVDRFGGYVAWHGLMTAAGRLFATQAVVAQRWESDTWAAFRSGAGLSRRDGYWLADATDWTDPAMAKALPMPAPKEPEDREADAALLLPLIGLTNGNLPGDQLVVDGSWSLADHLDIYVTTLLASENDAEAIAWGAVTGPPFFRGLHDPSEDHRFAFASVRSAEAWLEQGRRGEEELDRHDPYRSPSAMARSRPAQQLIDLFALKADDPIVRSWSDAHGTAFVAQAWGAEGGRGEQHWDRSGDRLSVRSSFLKALLGRKRRVLVGTVRARLYLEKPFRAEGEEDINFIYRSTAFTVDAYGAVKVMSALPDPVERAVEGLALRDQSEFADRCRVIKAALRKA